MQAANISYGIETTAVALDDGDDDDEGGGEGVVKQESLTENEELKTMMGIPDQVEAVIMEVQQDEADPGASTVSGEYNWQADWVWQNCMHNSTLSTWNIAIINTPVIFPAMR